MKEKKLLEIWKKYIDRPMYRVVPKIDYTNIIKKGIDPKKNPYNPIKKEVIKFRNIIKRLEDKGFIVISRWGKKEVGGLYAIDVTLHDFEIDCVDFTSQKDLIPYYLRFKGGAATGNLKKLVNEIKAKKFLISNREKILIDKIDKWLDKRICENIAFYISGNSYIFENALFQRRRKSGKGLRRKVKKIVYLASPFGSFEHFKKIIEKYGLKKYRYYLENELFYLRVRSKIPAREIRKVEI